MQSWAWLIFTRVANQEIKLKCIYYPHHCCWRRLACAWDDRELRALFLPKLSWFAMHTTLSVLKIQIIWLQLLQWSHNFFPPQALIQHIECNHLCNRQLAEQFWKYLVSKPMRFHKSCGYNLKVPWPLYILFLQMSSGKKGNLWYLSPFRFQKRTSLPRSRMTTVKAFMSRRTGNFRYRS